MSDPNPRDDWQGLGDLISLTVERLVAPVEGIHRAISDRWFGLAGPGVDPLRRAYQGYTAGIYRSVRVSGDAIGKAMGWWAASAARRGGLRGLWDSRLGAGVQATANALWGDELERRGSHLGIEMGLRDAEGAPLGSNPTSITEALVEPTGRIVVLLHGLGETERCWLGRTDTDETSLADVLMDEAFTPLLVRYNTGRHVSDNGMVLAALLEEIVDGWPVAVEEVDLVGHSMGGLVARSAVSAGKACGHRWTEAARHLVTLGSPHLGSPLEKGANLVSWGLGFAPESRPLGEFLDGRSVGIKDLRFGAVVEKDWRDADPNALVTDLIGEVPVPVNVEQHFVAGVVTNEPNHPFGVLVGDLIVRAASGTGRGRRRRIEATDVVVFGGRSHLDLLHDPGVHSQVLDWFTAEPTAQGA